VAARLTHDILPNATHMARIVHTDMPPLPAIGSLKGSQMNPIGLLFVALGVFTALAAALDWDWFMEDRKARFIVRLFGRGGARMFYALLGFGFIVLGAFVAAGVILDTQWHTEVFGHGQNRTK
jgi:hypothetical protein